MRPVDLRPEHPQRLCSADSPRPVSSRAASSPGTASPRARNSRAACAAPWPWITASSIARVNASFAPRSSRHSRSDNINPSAATKCRVSASASAATRIEAEDSSTTAPAPCCAAFAMPASSTPLRAAVRLSSAPSTCASTERSSPSPTDPSAPPARAIVARKFSAAAP